MASAFKSDKPAPTAVPVIQSKAHNPAHVSATGLVEARTGTIAIGTPIRGIVSHLNVTWGQWVEKGAPLFEIDDREVAGKRPTAVAELAKTEAAIPPAMHNLEAAESLRVRQFVTRHDLDQRQSELIIARADVDTARAHLSEIDAERERYIVRAPITGRILKINLRPGEYRCKQRLSPGRPHG